MDILVVVLALTLGFVLGVGVGALRAFRIAARRRSLAGANAGLARLFPENLPTRSASDILAGRIRVVLGGVGYELPVLPRRASREWLESLDARFAAIAEELDQAADDKPRILALLAGQTTGLLYALRAYDQTGVLPDPAYIDDFATDSEILVAMVEVWRAANPLAATLVAGIPDETTDGIPPGLPSSSPLPTGGSPDISTGTSRMSSSSPS
jgi:hypothetical protein